MTKRTWLLVAGLLIVGVLGAAVLVWRHPSVQESLLARADVKTLKARVTADPTDWRAQYWFGRRSAEHGDFLQAEPALRTALGSQPDYLPALTELGKVALAQNRIEEAYQLLRMVTGRDPGNLEARVALAVLYRNQAAYRQAMDEASAVLERNPRHAGALYELGASQALSQQFDKAEATFRQALEVGGKDPELLVGLARVLLQKGQLPEAEQFARQVVQQDGNSVSGLLVLGQILARKQPAAAHQEEALQQLKKARELDPTHVDVIWSTAQILGQQGKWQAAIVDLSEVIRRDPDRTQAYFLLSRAYRQINRLPESKKAEAIFRKREAYDRNVLDLGQKIAADPRRTDLRFKLAELHAEAGHPDRAANVYRRALDLEPQNAAARKRLSELLQQAVQR